MRAQECKNGMDSDGAYRGRFKVGLKIISLFYLNAWPSLGCGSTLSLLLKVLWRLRWNHQQCMYVSSFTCLYNYLEDTFVSLLHGIQSPAVWPRMRSREVSESCSKLPDTPTHSLTPDTCHLTLRHVPLDALIATQLIPVRISEFYCIQGIGCTLKQIKRLQQYRTI